MIYYVYCHDCKRLIFKGAKADAIKISCGKHGITFATLEYINEHYPLIDTSDWHKGELTVIEGDATSPQTTYPNEISIIPHVCNSLGGWGAGFVLALSRKWDKPKQIYLSYLLGQKGLPVLGKTCFAKIDNTISVANMIAQNGYISADNPIPLSYKALVNCMADVAEYVLYIQSKTTNRVVIHCPKFGSELSGGSWPFILELIRELWIEQGIDVVVYEWVG